MNICADAFAQKLKEASAVNKLPKVLIAVHMAGHSPEMDRIKALADQYDICIIEDASHSIGASFKGQKVGNCSHSDITIFSFILLRLSQRQRAALRLLTMTIGAQHADAAVSRHHT